MKTIPLVAYWSRKVGFSGPMISVPVDPEHPDFAAWRRKYDKQQSERAELEMRAWKEVCQEAASGKIKVKAFRHVSKPEQRAWYPDYPDSNLLEDIPADFFSHPDKIMIGPAEPVTIYWTDAKMGGPFNAPWLRPIVMMTEVLGEPIWQELTAWYRRHMTEKPDATREEDAAAASQHFGFRIKRETIRHLRAELRPIDHPSRKVGRRRRVSAKR